MRAVSLHRDVIVVTSAVLQVNCVIVRGSVEGALSAGEAGDTPSGPREAVSQGETFVIDSPVLPDELDALPALVEQARFAAPSGLLATHGDWDHLLGRLAFPGAALGCAQSTAERLQRSPGEAQRQLREFDEDMLIERARPLALGSIQALPTPGRCDLGNRELELRAAPGHTPDGMAILIGWAGVLVAGDYLSAVELPTLNDGGGTDVYLATLERLRPLVESVEHVVTGHGPILGCARALGVLEQDRAYVMSLRDHGDRAELPAGRRGAAQRRAHAANVRRAREQSAEAPPPGPA